MFFLVDLVFWLVGRVLFLIFGNLLFFFCGVLIVAARGSLTVLLSFTIILILHRFILWFWAILQFSIILLSIFLTIPLFIIFQVFIRWFLSSTFAANSILYRLLEISCSSWGLLRYLLHAWSRLRTVLICVLLVIIVREGLLLWEWGRGFKRCFTCYYGYLWLRINFFGWLVVFRSSLVLVLEYVCSCFDQFHFPHSFPWFD